MWDDNREPEMERWRLRQVWGDWLSEFVWHHFVTLTFRPDKPEKPGQRVKRERSIDAIERLFKFGFVRRASWFTHRPLAWYAVIERGKGGLLHVHALMWGTDALTMDQFGSAWKAGLCDIARYDWRLGAAHYVAKDIAAGAEWFMSKRWPPRLAKSA